MNLGPFEIIVILVVVLVIFGPKNLPKLGSAFGKTVKNVREGMDSGDDEAEDEDEESVEDEDDEDVEDVAEAPKKKSGKKSSK